MTDISERLRQDFECDAASRLCEEAADEIDRMRDALRDLAVERDILRRDNANHRAERERLRAALDVAGGALHRWVPGSSEDEEQAAAAHHRQVGLDAVRAGLGAALSQRGEHPSPRSRPSASGVEPGLLAGG